MKLTVVTPPAEEPISIEEAKKFCRMHLDITDDDELVESLITAARELLESRLARRFVEATLRETRTVPSDGIIKLLRAPVAEIISVEVDGEPLDEPPPLQGEATIEITPPGATVVIEYKAGYGPSSDQVPDAAKTIIKMLVAHWYTRRTPTSRDAQNSVPLHIDALCDSLRWGGSIPR